MIRFDRSWSTVLVTCTECVYWYALRTDQPAAYRAGEAHQMSTHGMAPNRATEPRRLWEKRQETRHAAKK